MYARSPAAFCRISRSSPIAEESASASARCRISSHSSTAILPTRLSRQTLAAAVGTVPAVPETPPEEKKGTRRSHPSRGARDRRGRHPCHDRRGAARHRQARRRGRQPRIRPAEAIPDLSRPRCRAARAADAPDPRRPALDRGPTSAATRSSAAPRPWKSTLAPRSAAPGLVVRSDASGRRRSRPDSRPRSTYPRSSENAQGTAGPRSRPGRIQLTRNRSRRPSTSKTSNSPSRPRAGSKSNGRNSSRGPSVGSGTSPPAHRRTTSSSPSTSSGVRASRRRPTSNAN